MKELHEKKISELELDTFLGEEGIKYELKKWAIAKNKNCNECQNLQLGIKKGKRCKACAERIVDFELTEEDLK